MKNPGNKAVERQISRITEIYVKKGLMREEYFSLIMSGKYTVNTPSEATLSLFPTIGPNLYDLSYFRCVKCGRVYNLETSRHGVARERKCPICREDLVQVPIHYPSKTSWASRIGATPPIKREGNYIKGAIFSAIGKQDPNSECPLLRRTRQDPRYVKRIVRMNPGRPLASLRWGCPFVDYENGKLVVQFVDEEGKRYSEPEIRWLFRNRQVKKIAYKDDKGVSRTLNPIGSPVDCPFLVIRQSQPLCFADKKYGSLKKSSEPIRLSGPVTVRFAALNLDDYSFGLNVPMEPSFKNLQGEFHVAQELDPLTEGADQLKPLVRGLLFSRRLIVYTFVFGTLYGHPEAPRRRRVLYVRKDSEGYLELWGRKLETEGLILKFDKKALASAVRALRSSNPGRYQDYLPNEIAEVVVHSIGHLLWKSVVMKTGLNYDELGESILVTKDGSYEYALYDNADGGLGGVRSALILNEEGKPIGIDPDVLELASQNVACESLCESACKACIVIPSCHRGNYDLDWRVLSATLFNLKGAF